MALFSHRRKEQWRKGGGRWGTGAWVVGLNVLLLCASSRNSANAVVTPNEYRIEGELVWFDDFDGDIVDGDKWAFDEGDGCDQNLCTWGNQEEQHYRSENAEVSDGALRITVKEEVYASSKYTSSKLVSRQRADFKYGRVEARITLPEAADGLWPAFWMLSTDQKYGGWPRSGEIDIMEARNDMLNVKNNLVYGQGYPNQSTAASDDKPCYEELANPGEPHVFAMEWTESEFRWFVDGNETCQHDFWFSEDLYTGETIDDRTAPFDEKFYLILNVAVNGSFTGSDKAVGDVDGKQMVVDYVRVYQDASTRDPPPSVFEGDAIGTGAKQGVEVWPGGDVVAAAAIDDSADAANSSATATFPLATWKPLAADAGYCNYGSALCNSEVQAYSEEAIAVDESTGVLSISVSYDADTDLYSSGLVESQEAVTFTHGRAEAYMKVPNGVGVATTMWLTPTSATEGDSDPRIYVMGAADGVLRGGLEGDGLETTTCVAPFLSASGDSLGDGYHLFAVEWTPQGFVRWYVDDVQYCEAVGYASVLDEEMYLSVNVVVGRDTEGEAIDGPEVQGGNVLPATLEVEYVRVLQFEDWQEPAPSRYVTDGFLIFSDEFKVDALDLRRWTHEIGNGCPENCGNGNNEAQWYQAENVEVSDDTLQIIAKQEISHGSIYTSGKVSTNGTASFHMGSRFEVRAKLPHGEGMWPAIWLMPVDPQYGDWPASGEIDLMENRNYMEKLIGSLHFGREYEYGTRNQDNLINYRGGLCYDVDEEHFSDDFHTYAMEWEPDAFRWYVDGHLYCERKYWYSVSPDGTENAFPAPFDQEFYLIMNIAVGGTFTGGIIMDGEDFPTTFAVDWVRVYSMDENDIIFFEPDPTFDNLDRGGSSVSLMTVGIVVGVIAGLCLACCVGKALMGSSKKGDHVEMGGAVVSPMPSDIGSQEIKTGTQGGTVRTSV